MAGGSKSKNKGSGAERELCKMLAEVFGGSFIRSNNSGAFVGGKNVFRKANLTATQNLNMKGDIVTPDELSHLCIESKFYAAFSFHQLLSGSCAQLDEWIAQNLHVMDEKDICLIMFKINRLGWYVATPPNEKYVLTSYANYIGKHGTFVVSQLEPFLKDNKGVLEMRPE